MISVTVTPTFTEDTLTFSLPDGPISETVVAILHNSLATTRGEVGKLRVVTVETKTDDALVA